MPKSKVKVRDEFDFLNRLRESGAVNMFGATPHLEQAFDLTKRDARKVLMEWMSWVDKNPDNVNL